MQLRPCLLLTSFLSVAARDNIPTRDVDEILKNSRIIGGDKADEGRYPYAVSVQMNGEHQCGGTLIAKDVVLTATHCLVSNAGFSVIVGRTDTTNTDEGEVINVIMMLGHPLFDPCGTWEYDFALLFLAKPVTLPNIQLMALNTDEQYPPGGTTGLVMGWGDVKQQIDKYQPSEHLMTVETEMISNEECATAEGKLDDGSFGSYENWIYPAMICTLSKKQNACNGDSGGPLIVLGEDPTKDVQIGVVSWSMPGGCATKVFPVVYGRISSVIDWFKQHVCTLSVEPPVSLCGTPEPTDVPTENPTSAPTNSPLEPTVQPTNYPTTEPSGNPTMIPSIGPTASPTIRPTKGPTKAPTREPTIVLSSEVTTLPTTGPTELPSSTPSTFPLLSPTRLPSFHPSQYLTYSSSDVSSIDYASEPYNSTQPSLQSSSLQSLFIHPTTHPTFSLSGSAIPSLDSLTTTTLSGKPTSGLSPTSTAPTEQPMNPPSLSHLSISTLMPTAEQTNEPTDIPTEPVSLTSKMSTSQPSSESKTSTTMETQISAILEEMANSTSLSIMSSQTLPTSSTPPPVGQMQPRLDSISKETANGSSVTLPRHVVNLFIAAAIVMWALV